MIRTVRGWTKPCTITKVFSPDNASYRQLTQCPAQCGEVRKRLHSSSSYEPEVSKRPRHRGCFANQGSIEADLNIERNSRSPPSGNICTEDTATNSTSPGGTQSGDTTPRSQTADGSESPGSPSCPSGSRTPSSADQTTTNDLGLPQQQMMDNTSIHCRETNSANITEEVHVSPNRSQMEAVGRHDLHHIDNITNGGNFGSEVSNSPVITIMPMNDTTEVIKYQRPVAASESTIGNSPFSSIPVPSATRYQVEDGFIQLDCVMPISHCPSSPDTLQPARLHENEQLNMVVMNENSLWSNPNDMTMIPTWPYEPDMTMIPSWDLGDGMAMIQHWTDWSPTNSDSALQLGFPYTESSQSTARHGSGPP
jgi:hypothetical protein